MRKFAKRSFQQLNEANNFHEQNCWKIIAKEEEKEKLGNDGDEIRCGDHHTTSYDSTKDDSDSSNSFPSSSSSDLIEVTSSSSTSSSSSNGPLFKLSDLMSQLPIKRGLSKYYEGKSQSYATLASVESLEDLAKRENPHRNKRIKYCKSFCGGLELDHHNGQRLFCNPIKATTISKKTPSNSEALFFFQNTRERC